MKVNTRTFEGFDGVRISATEAGKEGAQPVLLAHGGGQTKRAWRGTLDALAHEGFHAIAVDLRGHGESSWSDSGDYHLTSFGKDLLAVARSLSQKPALVGASLGGLAGLAAEGVVQPGSFSSLTLVDVTPRMETAGTDRIRNFMIKNLLEGFGSLDEAADAIADYMPGRKRRGPSDGLKHYLRQKDDGRFYWHWDPAFMLKRNEARSMETSELEQAAASLKLPVHLVRGGSSDVVSVEGAEHFQKLVPHARYSDITDAGHMVAGDRNDAFSDAIVTFLKDSAQAG